MGLANQGGPELIFIFLPNLFQAMPGSNILIIVFFVAVLFAGISSMINLFEAPIAAMEQQLGLSRRISVSLIVALAFLIVICIRGIVADRMDFVSIYILRAGLAGIMFFWVYGWDFVHSEVRKGRRREPGKWFCFMARYVFCGLTLLVFILGIVFGGIG